MSKLGSQVKVTDPKTEKGSVPFSSYSKTEVSFGVSDSVESSSLTVASSLISEITSSVCVSSMLFSI